MHSRYFRWFVIPLLGLALASCAAGRQFHVPFELEELALEIKPPDGTSLVYVVRPSIGYPPCTMEIFIDDIHAGELPPATYSVILTDPGKRRLRVTGNDPCRVDKTVDIIMHENQIHFVYANLWGSSHLFLPEVDEDSGREMLQKCLLAPNETSRLLFPEYHSK